MPEAWECKIPIDSASNPHQRITRNFVDAILKGEELIVPGENGINEMEISNAIHMSAWKHSTVTVPVNPEEYYNLLKEKIGK